MLATKEPLLLNVLLLAAYTVGSVSGLVLLKSHLAAAARVLSGEVQWPAIGLAGLGAFLYVFSFLVWLLILMRMELSLAYPVAIGLTLVLSTILSGVVLHEQLSALRITGVVLIFLGILIVVRS